MPESFDIKSILKPYCLYFNIVKDLKCLVIDIRDCFLPLFLHFPTINHEDNIINGYRRFSNIGCYDNFSHTFWWFPEVKCSFIKNKLRRIKQTAIQKNEKKIERKKIYKVISIPLLSIKTIPAYNLKRSA